MLPEPCGRAITVIVVLAGGTCAAITAGSVDNIKVSNGSVTNKRILIMAILMAIGLLLLLITASLLVIITTVFVAHYPYNLEY